MFCRMSGPRASCGDSLAYQLGPIGGMSHVLEVSNVLANQRSLPGELNAYYINITYTHKKTKEIR